MGVVGAVLGVVKGVVLVALDVVLVTPDAVTRPLPADVGSVRSSP